MIEECPCKYCTDERHIGCHGKCGRYIEWRRNLDHEIAQKRLERQAQYSQRTGRWYKTPDGHWRNNKLPRKGRR